MEHPHHSGRHAMDENTATLFLRRFYWTTALLIPLLLVSNIGVKFLGVPDFAGRNYIGFGISLIIFYFSLIFFEHASHEIKNRAYGMMTLVSLAIASGFLFSVASTFLPYFGGMEFYLEISTLIWVLMFGHYLEAKSTATAGNSLQEVAKLLPKQAHLFHGDQLHDMPLEHLKPGDLILVKPGEKVPADGVIVEGSAKVKESLITGESKPVSKKEGQQVIAGSICLDGSLKIKIEKTGLDSTVGHIQKLVEAAHMTKPQLQYLADRVAAWLTFIALGTAILTVVIWTLFAGQTLAFALTLAVTVLVIACPHALGLAIPTVSTIATTLALKHGIFIKSLQKLEAARKINVVAFDKTGTLTEGNQQVTDFDLMEEIDEVQSVLGWALPREMSIEQYILSLVISLESASEHSLAQAIIYFGNQKKITQFAVKNFRAIAGAGVIGIVDGRLIAVGTPQLMQHQKVMRCAGLDGLRRNLLHQGKTVISVGIDGKNVAILAISDKIRDESRLAVTQLHDMGVKVAMITGDNEGVGAYVAGELGIDTYFANVLPEDKYQKIKGLQAEGNRVMMVGDGVNDAPALIQANVGVAIGAGTDVTVEAGDIILTRNNPADIPKVLTLSKKVYGKMMQNLVWAVGYNVVAIPTAAGIFSKFGIFLRPDVGAFLMAMSSVIVVINALQLRRVRL